MAKYTITYTCGHTATEQLYGKHTEREKYIEYAERSKLCPTCFAAAQQAQRAAEHATYAAQAEGWPILTGSEKQIAWATTIRGKFLEALAAMPVKDATGIAEVQAAVCRRTDSRWWIDQRHNMDNALTGVKTLVNTDEILRNYLDNQRLARTNAM